MSSKLFLRSVQALISYLSIEFIYLRKIYSFNIVQYTHRFTIEQRRERFCRYTDRTRWPLTRQKHTHANVSFVHRHSYNHNNKIEGKNKNESFTRELPIHVGRLRFDWESCSIRYGPLSNQHSTNSERVFVYQKVGRWSNCCLLLRAHWRRVHCRRLSSLAQQYAIRMCVVERRSHVARHSLSDRYRNANQFHRRAARRKSIVVRVRFLRRFLPRWLLHPLVMTNISSFVHWLV